jgi:saccharopine dehydrogenase (NAD+, L-lysine-forming)
MSVILSEYFVILAILNMLATMNNKVAIRIEDKYAMERRVPIIPKHVSYLKEKFGLDFYIESSSKRVFTDKEFEIAGAKVVSSICDIPVVFGVKEMPSGIFQEGFTYVFFSHTIKGQSANMPELKKMVEKKVNLIDYEKMRDDQDRRTIFFGRYAGLAGMINTFWAFGQRLNVLGITTPFLKLKQAYRYHSLAEAESTILAIKEEIETEGLPREICPLTIGITGYGHVGSGVKEILGLLNPVELSPEELLELENSKKFSDRSIYITTFRENNLVRPAGNFEFELQDYYRHPEKYIGDFEKYISKLSILVNSMYWDKRYPKLITAEHLKAIYSSEHKLKTIGDITCDPEGSIEFTLKCTTIEDPVFIYDHEIGSLKSGFKGRGICVLAVDILPSELPRESSEGFSSALLRYIPDIVKCDYSVNYDELNLPASIKKGLILHNGKFTPEFTYMEEFIK